jgi:hypothetical protein
MTLSEFDSFKHHGMMWVMHNGRKKYVISLSFTERLFALVDDRGDFSADEWQWVRCENVELIKCKTLAFPKKNNRK